LVNSEKEKKYKVLTFYLVTKKMKEKIMYIKWHFCLVRLTDSPKQSKGLMHVALFSIFLGPFSLSTVLQNICFIFIFFLAIAWITKPSIHLFTLWTCLKWDGKRWFFNKVEFT